MSLSPGYHLILHYSVSSNSWEGHLRLCTTSENQSTVHCLDCLPYEQENHGAEDCLQLLLKFVQHRAFEVGECYGYFPRKMGQ